MIFPSPFSVAPTHRASQLITSDFKRFQGIPFGLPLPSATRAAVCLLATATIDRICLQMSLLLLFSIVLRSTQTARHGGARGNNSLRWFARLKSHLVKGESSRKGRRWGGEVVYGPRCGGKLARIEGKSGGGDGRQKFKAPRKSFVVKALLASCLPRSLRLFCSSRRKTISRK